MSIIFSPRLNFSATDVVNNYKIRFQRQSSKQLFIMRDRKSKSGTSLWVAIGAVVLIILLIVWLTIADFFGDTDVAALITPFC